MKATTGLLYFNEYIYVTDEPTNPMPDEFYAQIYSKFKPEEISNVEFKNIACILKELYKLPTYISQTILNDYDAEKIGKLSINQYEDIMKQLYIVNPLVLDGRMKTFKKCDFNDDGYIDLDELPFFQYYLYREIVRTKDCICLHSIENIISCFNMTGNGKLNFLDANQYMDHLNTNFI